MQEEVSAFEQAAEPLREAKNAEGLLTLHKSTKQRLITMISPFMPGVDLSEELWPAPEDPLTLNLDLQSMLGYLLRNTPFSQVSFIFLLLT